MSASAIAQVIWNYLLEGSYSAGTLLRIIAAVMAGKSVIISSSVGSAHVIFRTLNDMGNILEVDTVDSERTSVTITP